jgi:phage baseplate assembly protein V
MQDIIRRMLATIDAHRDKIDDLDRRIANLIRPVKTIATDPAQGKVKVSFAKDSDGADVPTNWARYATKAGKVRDWNPPSIGEQGLMLSPSGEISGEASWILPGGFNNEFPRNNDQDGERKIQVGDDTWLHFKEREIQVYAGTAHGSFKDGEISLEVGGTKIQITAGKIKIVGAQIENN